MNPSFPSCESPKKPCLPVLPAKTSSNLTPFPALYPHPSAWGIWCCPVPCCRCLSFGSAFTAVPFPPLSSMSCQNSSAAGSLSGISTASVAANGKRRKTPEAVSCFHKNRAGNPSPPVICHGSSLLQALDQRQVAVENRIVAQLRHLDIHRAANLRQAVAVHLFQDLFQEQVAHRFNDAAAVKDQVR